ncbi:MAG: alcohol dehydrogenase catalytic domain-containing protein [Planctomycetota bacterium]
MRALCLGSKDAVNGTTTSPAAPALRADYPDPAPAAGEALLRPTRLGVCSTDLELCRGYMGFAGVLGHEFVAVVEDVADAEHRPWVGQRVVGEINCPCGACDLCRAGVPTHCRNRTVLGILNRDGAFADRFTLPVANLHAVPDAVEDDRAVFVEPLAAAAQILEQVDVADLRYVTVLGDGRLGLLCAQVLARANPRTRCVGKHDDKLQRCEKWGVVRRPLDEAGQKRDQDLVVDCTGSASGLRTALGMVRPRGTIVLKTTVAPPAPGSAPAPGNRPSPGPGSTSNTAGSLAGKHENVADPGAVAAPPSTADLAQIVIDEVTVLGSRCGPFDPALRLLAGNAVDVASLITHRARLDDGVQALQKAAEPGQIKVLIEP